MDLFAATRIAIASVIRNLLLYLSFQAIKIFQWAHTSAICVSCNLLKYYTLRLKFFALRDGLSEIYEVLNKGLN